MTCCWLLRSSESPFNLLLPNRSYNRNVSWQIEPGIMPSSLFPAKSKADNFCKPEISVGRVPVSELLLRFSTLKLVRLKYSWRIVPFRWFNWSFTPTSLWRLPSSFGNLRCNWFKPRSRDTRFVRVMKLMQKQAWNSFTLPIKLSKTYSIFTKRTLGTRDSLAAQ